MRIKNSQLSLIVITCVLVLVYAPLLMKIVLYHLDIRGIYPLTLAFLSLLGFFVTIVNRGFRFTKIDFFVLLFFIFVSSRFFLDGQIINFPQFFTQAIFPYMLGRLLAGVLNRNVVRPLYVMIGFAAMLILIEYIVNPDVFLGDRLRLFETNLSETGDETGGATQHYAGSLFGVGAIISYMCLMANRENTLHQEHSILTNYLFFIVSMAGLLFISSKSALIAVGLCLIIISIQAGRFTRFLKLFLFSSLPVTALFFIISTERQSFFLELTAFNYREVIALDVCFTPEDGGSVLGRLTMILDSIEIWLNHVLLGAGPGNFGLLDCDTNPKRDFTHPHNIVFGLLAETGIVGFGLFVVPLAVLYRRLACYDVFSIQGQFLMILIFEVLQSLFVSSGYIGNVGIYLFIGLCVSTIAVPREAGFRIRETQDRVAIV